MKKRSIIDTAVILTLLLIFTVTIMSVLTSGASAYRKLTESGEKSFNSNTVINYIATKIRASDMEGCVDVVEFGDGSALEIDDKSGISLIYTYEGSLYELYIEAGTFDKYNEIEPCSGKRLLTCGKLSLVKIGDNLIKISCKDADREIFETSIALRSVNYT